MTHTYHYEVLSSKTEEKKEKVGKCQQSFTMGIGRASKKNE